MKFLVFVALFLLTFSAFAADVCYIEPFNIDVNDEPSCPTGNMGYIVSGPAGVAQMFTNDGYCGQGVNDTNDAAFASAMAFAKQEVAAGACATIQDDTQN